jgi:hypothetical protein
MPFRAGVGFGALTCCVLSRESARGKKEKKLNVEAAEVVVYFFVTGCGSGSRYGRT